jgi:hypothetical protein
MDFLFDRLVLEPSRRLGDSVLFLSLDLLVLLTNDLAVYSAESIRRLLKTFAVWFILSIEWLLLEMREPSFVMVFLASRGKPYLRVCRNFAPCFTMLSTNC